MCPLLRPLSCSIVLDFGIAWVLHHLALLMHDLCFLAGWVQLSPWGCGGQQQSSIHLVLLPVDCRFQSLPPLLVKSAGISLHTLSASFLIRAQSLWFYDIIHFFFCSSITNGKSSTGHWFCDFTLDIKWQPKAVPSLMEAGKFFSLSMLEIWLAFQ